MSPRFWMIAAGFVVSGLFAGASLGGFAAGHAQGGLAGSQWATSDAFQSVPDHLMYGSGGRPAKADTPPEPVAPVVCKGCGPTLAERQMMADGYGGDAVDPYLRDYARSDYDAVQPVAEHERPKAAMARMPTPLVPVAEQAVAPAVDTIATQ
jgi:hypothetical protein